MVCVLDLNKLTSLHQFNATNLAMKKIATILTAASITFAAQTVSLNAAPLVSIGDTVDIFFRGAVAGQYRSNVFNNPNKADDYLAIVSPGLEVNIGRNSNANIKIVFREDLYYYNKFASQNTQRANLFIDGVYNTGPLTSGAGFSFVQRQQNTADVVGIPGTNANQVETNNYRAYIEGEYDISPKTYVDGAFEFLYRDYTNNDDFGNAYSDRFVYSAPINAYYRYSPKLGIGLGYRFRYTDVDNNQNTTVLSTRNPGDYMDNFVSLALDGELFPKLTTQLNVGWENRNFNAQGLTSDNTIAVLSTFNYLFSDKLNFDFGFNRDFGTGSIGQSSINTGGFIGATYDITQFIAANARFSMVNSDYTGADINGVSRSDDTTRASFALSYTPNVYWQFTAGYTYINNDSNISNASFMGHTVDLSASLRY